MNKTDALVRLLLPDIEGKDILEPACGAAAFSVSAAPFAAPSTASIWTMPVSRRGPAGTHSFP